MSEASLVQPVGATQHFTVPSKEPFVNKFTPDPDPEVKVTVSFSAFIVVQFVESLLTCHV